VNEKDAKQMILIALLVSGLMAASKDVFKGNMPKGRIFFGILVAGLLLSILAEFAPEVAGPLAALLLVTALFGQDGGAINTINVFKKVGKI
jgi:hypothetical protein